MNYIERVERSITNVSVNRDRLKDLKGIDPYDTLVLLNDLCSYPDVHHLHLGINSGLSFIGAMYKNRPLSCFGIDNYCQGNRRQEANFKQSCIDNNINDFVFFDEDCFNLKPESKSQIKNINMYFYDAEHEESDQYQAFMYYLECMAPTCIMVIDDLPYPPVEAGIKKAVKDNKFVVDYQKELKGGTWCNGLMVMVISKLRRN